MSVTATGETLGKSSKVDGVFTRLRNSKDSHGLTLLYLYLFLSDTVYLYSKNVYFI